MTLPTAITVEWTFKRRTGAQAKPVAPDAACQERIPRLARLMALAIKFDSLIRQGVIRDYADLARLGHVSRGRITQIMNLLHMAPDIQERLLDSVSAAGHATICERHIRNLARLIHWSDQRRQLQKMCASQAFAATRGSSAPVEQTVAQRTAIDTGCFPIVIDSD